MPRTGLKMLDTLLLDWCASDWLVRRLIHDMRLRLVLREPASDGAPTPRRTTPAWLCAPLGAGDAAPQPGGGPCAAGADEGSQ